MRRSKKYEALKKGGIPDTPTGKRPAGIVPVPLMVNPTRCGVAQEMGFEATPYALPTLHSAMSAPMSPTTGCGLVGFDLSLTVSPTSANAETSSGIDVKLTFPTDGLEHPNLLVGSELKRAEVALPEGVTANPSQAVGLGVCSEADFAREIPRPGS